MHQEETYNEGIYADPAVAAQWIAWIENLELIDTRFQHIYPYLSKWIKQHHPKKVLEIGSGQGTCSEQVALSGAEYVGVEPSKHLRDRAISQYPDRRFIPGTAEQLPLPAASIDAVFSVFVWFHIEAIGTAARELSRVLKTGGLFSIVTANPDMYDKWKSWHTNVVIDGKKLVGDMKRLPGNVMYLYSLDEIIDSLVSHGLTVIDIRRCGTPKDETATPGFAIIISGKK